MRAHCAIRALASGVLLTGCSAPPQRPVPLVGAAADVAVLAGHWEGAYASAATGRSGSVSFTLTANGDSAFGDVVMIPRSYGRPLQPWNNVAAPAPVGAALPHSAVLTISFVRVAAGRVTGRLAPYADPETGLQLFTSFDGRVRGNVIEGTFTTRTATGGESQSGEWKVTRQQE